MTDKKDQIHEIKSLFPRGRAFMFLGRTCMPTGYCRPLSDIGPVVAELRFMYADNNGVLREMSFDYDTAIALWKYLAAN